MQVRLPALSQPLPAYGLNPDFLDFLSWRRSSSAAQLSAPGPSSEMLDKILQVAVRVPDHRKLVPFRIVIVDDQNRSDFLKRLLTVARTVLANAAEMSETAITGAFATSPITVAVISSPTRPHRTPEWEQRLVSGVVCYNILLAASAAGFAGSWLTGWAGEEPAARAIFDLAEHDLIAGFVHLGTPREMPRERERPDAAKVIARWRAT